MLRAQAVTLGEENSEGMEIDDPVTMKTFLRETSQCFNVVGGSTDNCAEQKPADIRIVPLMNSRTHVDR